MALSFMVAPNYCCSPPDMYSSFTLITKLTASPEIQYISN